MPPGAASDFAGVMAPTICWGPASCTGDPDGGWYTVSSPGPLNPCTTSTGTPPTFDNDTTMNDSVLTTFNLTPSTSYSCTTPQGQLSYNATTQVLTIAGTVFIDGNVTMTTSGNTPVTYTGTGSGGACTNNGDCQSVLYASGDISVNSEKLCAVVSGNNCDWNNWNPNKKILIFASNGPNGITVGPSQTSFQGGLYATNTVTTGQGALTEGPLVSGTKVVSLGQQFGGTFPPITILPLSIQQPPGAFWINPPTDFCNGISVAAECSAALKRRCAGVDNKVMDFVLPLVFVPGLAIGSFLGVVAARVPLRRSIVRPGSACMSCETPIRWYDNVPVLSYALLRGRCRRCGIRIPPRDLAIEVTTALLLVGCVLAFGFTAKTVAAAIGCAALVVATATDLERRIVPNRVVLPAAAAVLVLQTVFYPSPAWALGALGAAGFLFVAALAYPGGMGMGDVKLALLIGALLGRTTPVAIMLGLLLALVPSVVLIARHGAGARRLAIPFAPFLAAGAVIALFAGESILHAYLNLT